VKANRFGEFVPLLTTMSGVAAFVMRGAICAGVAVGSDCKCNATMPATCGDAIDVPDNDRIAVEEVLQADTTLTPGANTSKQAPKFENDARTSVLPVAPTVIALDSDAGEYPHASRLLFPAATTNTMPSATPRATAAFSDKLRMPPRLMLATAGVPAEW
jgi:hypothetical protein